MQMRFMKKLHLLVLLLLAFTSSNATTHVVTNHNDSGAGSLRNAVNISTTSDTIRFDPSLVSGGNDTIKLLTEISTSNNLVIIGLRSASNTLYISGQGTSRILSFYGTGAVLDSLAFINSRATNGSAVYVTATGATLHVKNCIFKNNLATQRGGAIHFYNGDLQIINSSFSNDSATTEGGAIYNQLCQSILLNGCTFDSNRTSLAGGAIRVAGTTVSTFDVVNCNFTSNRCGLDGGAIFYDGRYFTMDSSTLKYNTAGGTYGGIIYFFLQQSVPRISSTFSNSTIAQNTGLGIASVISLNNSTSVQTEMDVSYCSIYSNTSGGIFAQANTDDDNAVSTVTVSKSTIAYNGNTTAGYGGIYSTAFVLTGSWNVSSNVTVTNSTIVYNQSPNSGSGIFSKGKLAASSYLGVKSSIVAQNSGVGMYSYSAASSISSQGYNLFSDASVIGSQGTDQLGVSIAGMSLRPLNFYGGSTPNMMPNANSVAINGGTPTDLSNAQNGIVNGGRRDIGASEFTNCSSPVTNITESACGSFTLNGQTYTASGTYTQTFTNAAGCDSIISLNLTIIPNDNSQFTWAGRIGGANTDYGNSVATDKQGNVYSVGNFSGLIDVDPGATALNFNSGTTPAFYITKLDANGNLLWGGRITSNVSVYANSIKVDTSGNMYITGQFYGNCDFNPGGGIFNLLSGAPEIFILKLSTTGAFVWAKSQPYITGNYSSSESNALALDDAGNIYTTGGYGGTTDFDPGAGTSNLVSSGYQDIFVSKLDASGNLVWAKSMGNPTSGDVGNAIAVDASGNVYVTGHFQGTADFDPGAGTSNITSAGSTDVFVVKLNSSGNLVWAKALGGTNAEFGQGILCDASGNVYTIGNFQGTADFNPGVGSITLTSAGSNDIFISKLNASGNYLWANRIGSTLPDFCSSIKLDASGNIFTTGSFQGTVDFNPEAAVNNLISAGGADIFISKLDTDGVYIWAKRMGGTGDDRGSALQIDASGSLYLTGAFENTVDFDPNAGTFNLVADGGKDGYIMKFGACCVATTASISPNVCGSYASPSGLYTWTTSGTYRDTISNSVGCDSIITVNLTIRQKTTGTINQSICQGQSYLFNGVNRTTQGVYLDTLVNAAGCDSIVTLNLTVNSNPTAAISPLTAAICNGTNATLTASGGTTYAWSNSLGSNTVITVSPTTTTAYTVTVTNGSNCSATASKTVTVNQPPTAGISPNTITICSSASATLTASGGSSYAWSNSLGGNAAVTVSPTTTTTYTVTVTDANACTATASKTVTVNQLPTAGISPATASICNGASATLTATGGTSYAWSNSLGGSAAVTVSPTNTTTYSVTITDANTCTATASKTVTVNQLPTAGISPNSITICNGASTTLTASGGTSYAWSNSLGSNAAVTVSPITTTTYTVTVTDANTCTATATKTVIVNQLPTAGISPNTVTICNGASATLTASGGSSYAWSNSLGSNAAVTVSPTTTTTYTVTVTDANTCTATASKTVTVNQLPKATINGPTTICSGLQATLTAGGGTSYVWANNLGTNPQITVSPANTTSFTVTVTNANNCSATASQTVSVTTSPIANISGVVQLCSGQNTTLTANGGNTYTWGNNLGNNPTITISPTATTTYTVTATVGVNCSATASQTVTVYQPAASQFSATICSGNSYSFNGILVTTSGSYKDTLQTIHGCDSIVTLSLTVSPALTASRTQTICAGSSYLFNGQQLTSGGTYSDTLQNANGCDSIITLTLIVNPTLTGSLAATICSGSSYTFNGQQISNAGTYSDTLQNANGCDSIITLTLIVNPTLTGSVTTTICVGSSYSFNGQQLTQSGIYNDTVQSANSCDSIVTLNLTVAPILQNTISDTICKGDSYSFNNLSISQAGLYYDTLQTPAGCDSIVTLDLAIRDLPQPTITKNSDTLLTQGFATYQWLKNDSAIAGDTLQQITITTTGNYRVLVSDANGCTDTSAAFNVTSVGLNNVLGSTEFKLYPNPTNGHFTIEWSEGTAEIQIVNALGQIILPTVKAETKMDMDLQDYAAGVYFVHIRSNGLYKTLCFSLIK